MKETILWVAKAFLNVASIIVFIISLCSMDSESLWLPAIGLLASAAWIAFFILRDEVKDDEETPEQHRAR